MPSPNEIKLTAEEASRIPDSAWVFLEETEDFIRYEAKVTLPNGLKGVVLRTDPKLGDALLIQNAEARNETSGQRFTSGLGSDKGGNMPMVHTAAMPLNVYLRDFGPRKGDADYSSWWKRQEVNKPFLVRDKGFK